MAYSRKTIDRWDIEADFGFGWCVEVSEYTREAAWRVYKEYRDNPYPGQRGLRIVKHREKKEEK